MEIEKRNGNIVLQTLAVLESKESKQKTVRAIVPLSRLTERECELAISELISSGLIVDPDDFLRPSTQLEISDKGREYINSLNIESTTEFGSIQSIKHEQNKAKLDKKEEKALKAIQYEEALKTHEWYRQGSHDGGSGQITKDKWFPMGSICRKCGMTTMQFKRNPIKCPK